MPGDAQPAHKVPGLLQLASARQTGGPRCRRGGPAPREPLPERRCLQQHTVRGASKEANNRRKRAACRHDSRRVPSQHMCYGQRGTPLASRAHRTFRRTSRLASLSEWNHGRENRRPSEPRGLTRARLNEHIFAFVTLVDRRGKRSKAFPPSVSGLEATGRFSMDATDETRTTG